MGDGHTPGGERREGPPGPYTIARLLGPHQQQREVPSYLALGTPRSHRTPRTGSRVHTAGMAVLERGPGL